MRWLLLALFGLPSLANAGGLAVVEVVCYPENRFELCQVPVPDGHHPGYLPRTVPAKVRLGAHGPQFAILVTPNIVPYELAVRDAASAAASYCGQDPGEVVVARIDYRERYAPEDLESWKFAGNCE